MLSLASQANQPGWWHRYQDVLPGWFQAYIGLEESAQSIRSYDAQFVPGLLQTEDYAAAVLALGDFSLDERSAWSSCSRNASDGSRRAGSASGRSSTRWRCAARSAARVLRGQLEYLRDACGSRPHPAGDPVPRGGYVAPGCFSILRFGVPDLPDMVYAEQLTSATYLDKPVREVDALPAGACQERKSAARWSDHMQPPAGGALWRVVSVDRAGIGPSRWGNCVEVPSGPRGSPCATPGTRAGRLVFTRAEWDAFLAGARDASWAAHDGLRPGRPGPLTAGPGHGGHSGRRPASCRDSGASSCNACGPATGRIRRPAI